MKEATNVKRALHELQKIYDYFNNKYYHINQPIMITLKESKGSYGHMTVGKVWCKDGEAIARELNINPEYLDRPIENIVATMLHEMAHIYNEEHDIKDTSNGYTYHNKKFKETAEMFGLLTIEQAPTIGWSVTSPTEKCLSDIIEADFSDFRITRVKHTDINLNPPKKGAGEATKTKTNVGNGTSSTRKYICPKCRMTIRATKEVNVICGNCMERLVLA